MDHLSEIVGKKRVIVTDEETGEEIARGVVIGAKYEIGTDRLTNVSEIAITPDIPEVSNDPAADQDS